VLVNNPRQKSDCSDAVVTFPVKKLVVCVQLVSLIEQLRLKKCVLTSVRGVFECTAFGYYIWAYLFMVRFNSPTNFARLISMNQATYRLSEWGWLRFNLLLLNIGDYT